MEKRKNKKAKYSLSESTTRFIRKSLREGVNITPDSASDKSIKFKIIINGKEGGSAIVNKDIHLDKAIELSSFQLKPNYEHNTIGVARDLISSLWKKFNGVYKILIRPTTKSKLFWEKVGANRLNDTYHIFQKGH